MADIQVRELDLDSDDLARWLAVKDVTFLNGPPADPAARAEQFRPWMRGDRNLAAVDDRDRIVGTFSSWDTGLTVPGRGSVRCDAISAVTVLSTHRRRGALTALMTHDLAAAVERGMPVAVLIASEATIYGRYGFGVTTRVSRWQVDTTTARLRPGVARLDDLEIVPEKDLLEIGPAVFERSRRAGAMDRTTQHHWEPALGVTEFPGHPHKACVAVVVRDGDGVVQGFARYRTKDGWENRVPEGEIELVDLQAVTPDAYAALWGHLLEVDLIGKIVASERPADEPLPWLVTDARRVWASRTFDFLWTRLLDVPAALSARTYPPATARLAFAVDDDRGWAAGTYVLDVDAGGRGVCVRGAAAPELTLDVTALSSVWLGGGDLAALALAGSVREHTSGAVDRCAALLRTASEPWAADWF